MSSYTVRKLFTSFASRIWMAFASRRIERQSVPCVGSGSRTRTYFFFSNSSEAELMQ